MSPFVTIVTLSTFLAVALLTMGVTRLLAGGAPWNGRLDELGGLPAGARLGPRTRLLARPLLQLLARPAANRRELAISRTLRHAGYRQESAALVFHAIQAVIGLVGVAIGLAFLAVTRPILLPGEAFDGGDDLPPEALRWESWNDVGAAAYHFAEVFSERRIRLDPTTRDHLNSTIGSIRRCLTERLYPLLSDLDGSIGEQNRLAAAEVVGSLAADIRDARTTLEYASGPERIIRAPE